MNSISDRRHRLPALRPYPTSKDSGVNWLGEVPSHWDVHQLGRIGRFSKGSGGTKDDDSDEGVPCIRYGDLYTQHRFFITKSRACVPNARAAAYTPLRYGDVLFAGSGETIDEIGKSAVNLIRGTACCGGDVILFRPSIEIDARFLGYATDCPPAAYQKACMGRGITVMHIYWSDLKYLTVALPPLTEQAAIVRYLDFTEAKIRRYVDATRRLIARLEEQRQAMTHLALTRGLRSTAETKPSGVSWLGNIPSHWNVMRTKYLFREMDSRSKDGDETLLSMSQELGLVPSHLVERTLDPGSYVGRKICKEGDLVLNRLKAHLGVFNVAQQDGSVSPDYSVFRKKVPLEIDYFFACSTTTRVSSRIIRAREGHSGRILETLFQRLL